MVSPYDLHEAAYALLGPARLMSEATRLVVGNPYNPFSRTRAGRSLDAALEVFERTTRRYAKPAFDLPETTVDGERVAVTERVVWEQPFGRVLRFERATSRPVDHPRVLIVAPMSGHYATLLRGTVEAFLPGHDVHITDWSDAALVPAAAGAFDLDTYVDYVIAVLRALGPGTHVMAVCQPSVPVLAAVALMEAAGDPAAPRSMTLMGGPIDTRESPTGVNRLAAERGIAWFRDNCIQTVPMNLPGHGRKVYPGYLQLTGFMAMNLDKHVSAHQEFYKNLVKGDGEPAEKHRDFYDEYLAVMDLTAEFYLSTVDKVFVRHELPKGELHHRGARVDLAAVRRTGLLTVEGENDDISGIGQTRAAHRLCANLPEERRAHHLQSKVGHYGVFNGSRFRAEIAPRIQAFIRAMDALEAVPERAAA